MARKKQKTRKTPAGFTLKPDGSVWDGDQVLIRKLPPDHPIFQRGTVVGGRCSRLD